jgi:Lon protease-like protein
VAIVQRGKLVTEGRVDDLLGRGQFLRLKANNMDADWESINRATNCTLVTALCMMSPYGPAEKQALLEARDMRTRAETLVAITEILLARESGDPGSRIQ